MKGGDMQEKFTCFSILFTGPFPFGMLGPKGT